MNLVEKINDDIKNAMKNGEKDKLNVIRMVKSAIQMAKISLKHDLSDEEVIDVIGKQIKMRNDSILEFSKASRDDLVQQYENEIAILKTYMPEELSLEEVTSIIHEAFEKIKPTSSKEMGLLMKEITPKVKGRFDVSEVSRIVREKLNS